MSFFRDRTYIVTGGSRGVGRAIVDKLLLAGGNVVTCSRTGPSEQQQSSVRLTHLRLDASAPSAPSVLCDVATRNYGALHGIVSNAGTPVVGSALEVTDDEALNQFKLRVLAAWRLASTGLPLLSRGEGGSIVIIAGAAGIDPAPMLALMSVVNAALMALSRALADELAEHGVRVNTIAPGTLDTDLGKKVVELYAEKIGLDPEIVSDEMRNGVPLGRIPTADDVADSTLFFLGPHSSMITGGTLVPDGGILIRRSRG